MAYLYGVDSGYGYGYMDGFRLGIYLLGQSLSLSMDIPVAGFSEFQ